MLGYFLKGLEILKKMRPPALKSNHKYQCCIQYNVHKNPDLSTFSVLVPISLKTYRNQLKRYFLKGHTIVKKMRPRSLESEHK